MPTVGIGSVAPNFTAEDVKGEKITLQADKKYILAFHRYMGCIWCQADIMRLLKMKDELKSKGIETIIFVNSQKHSVEDYLKHFPNFPFIIIPDPDKKIYKLYGVESGNFLDMIPATINTIKNITALKDYKFVKDGIKGDRYLRPAFFGIKYLKIIYEFRAKNPADYPDLQKIIESLK